MSIDFSTLTEACKAVVEDEELFKNFKRNPGITKYFEHLSEEAGRKYYDYLIKNRVRLDDIIVNDDVGNPIKYSYGGHSYSPTTLRYIKVYQDLLKYFRDIEWFDIVEIGGGYGGQAKLIVDNCQQHLYTILDLTPVSKLQHEYTKDYRSIFCTSAINIIEKNIELVISNYAYSELSKEYQKKYFLKVLSPAKRGYMTLNNINDEFNRDEFIANMYKIKENVKVIPEEPRTGDNVILIWGHNA